MKCFWFILMVLLFCNPVISSAHEGHGEYYVMAEKEVIPIANVHLAGLIEESFELKGVGKLDESWNRVHDADKAITKKGDGYYIVSFKHPQQNKTLYLLLSSSGDLYDVNFSGNFNTKR
jgi:hypothetical protein